MTLIRTVATSTLIFAAAGPAIGALAFFCYLQVVSGAHFSGSLSAEMRFGYVLLIVGAYLIGSIPAAAAGIVFGTIVYRKRLRRGLYPFVGIAAGAFACVMFEAVLSIVSIAHGKGASLDFLVPLTFWGAVSGSICGLACRFAGIGAEQ